MTGDQKAEGVLTMRVSRGQRPPAAGRVVPWRWHLWNWLTVRWREIPLTLFVLLVLPVLRWLVPGMMVAHSRLHLRILHGDGTVTDLGCVGRHLITTAGKNYLAACMDATNSPQNLKYHGYGTGTTAAALADTALQTELTTQYATDNVRPTGSQAHATNTYTTVATLSPDSGGTIAVTEWGLLSQASNAGGTLYDHQVFSAVNLVAANGDSLQTTYVLTFS